MECYQQINVNKMNLMFVLYNYEIYSAALLNSQGIPIAKCILAFYSLYGMQQDIHRAIISYALYLYFGSRSLKLGAKRLESIIRRSHVAIWKWVQEYSNCADRFITARHIIRDILTFSYIRYVLKIELNLLLLE